MNYNKTANEIWCSVATQVLHEVSMVVVQAKQICSDIMRLDYEHICQRTKISGHRSELLTWYFLVALNYSLWYQICSPLYYCEVLVWLSVCSKVQTCICHIWPSWCHCHSLSLASLKSRLVLPLWFQPTRIVPEKGPLNVCYIAAAFSALSLLVGRKEGHPACKLWGTGVVIWLERGADLHMAQWLPLPLTVSWFSKIQIGFTYLVLAHRGSPRQRAVKWVCVLYYCSTCHRHNVYFLGTSTVDYDLQ